MLKVAKESFKATINYVKVLCSFTSDLMVSHFQYFLNAFNVSELSKYKSSGLRGHNMIEEKYMLKLNKSWMVKMNLMLVNVRGRDCKKESHDSTLSKGYEKVNNIDQMMMKYEEIEVKPGTIIDIIYVF
jgi:hypothetical protein